MTEHYSTTALKEFISTFDASLDPMLWVDLMHEETVELADEIMNGSLGGKENLLKEAADLFYVTIGLSVVCDDNPHFVELCSPERVAYIKNVMVDADKALTYSDAVFSEDVLEEAFMRVHASNMSKLDDDGKPIRREDGKILKGPNYKAPDLSDLV